MSTTSEASASGPGASSPPWALSVPSELSKRPTGVGGDLAPTGRETHPVGSGVPLRPWPDPTCVANGLAGSGAGLTTLLLTAPVAFPLVAGRPVQAGLSLCTVLSGGLLLVAAGLV
ncbi:hypothetical protein GCM10010388_73930 [Streptomyces mauvecolor]